MIYKYEFDKDKCCWRNVCSLYGTKDCNGSCIRYMKMHYLTTNSLLSEKQQQPVNLSLSTNDIDFNAYSELKAIRDDIISFVKNGNNLMIWSKNNGNGKTQWSLKLIMHYFSKIWSTDSFNVRGLFINAAKLVSALKDNISELNEYSQHIKNHIFNADLVVWDDIGLKSLTPYEHDYLYNFINGRIDCGKANIFTSNIIGEDFRSCVGDRLYSRIVNGSKVITFYGKDHRGGAK